MDYLQLLVFCIFALLAAAFLIGRLKYGSWTGAFLRASIEKTYGEIVLSRGISSSQVLKIMALKDRDGKAFVGLVISAKAPFSASVTPYRISKDQARELAGLLTVAAE